MSSKIRKKSKAIDHEPTDQEDTSPIKRKRGRPRKEETSVKPPKKIGRPKGHAGRKRKPAKSNYHLLQYALKKYAKEHNIHLGKRFNTVASTIWQDVPHDANLTIDYFDKNIHAYYKKVVRLKLPKRNFIDNVPFFSIKEEFSPPNFQISDNIIVDAFFHGQKWNFEGNYMEFWLWFYNEGAYEICRKFYDTSPYAFLKIIDTDNETFVKYDIIVSSDASKGAGETPKQPKEEEKKEEEVKPSIEEAKDELSGLTSEDKAKVLLAKEETKREVLKSLDEHLKNKDITFAEYMQALKEVMK